MGDRFQTNCNSLSQSILVAFRRRLSENGYVFKFNYTTSVSPMSRCNATFQATLLVRTPRTTLLGALVRLNSVAPSQATLGGSLLLHDARIAPRLAATGRTAGRAGR